ncbi:hypothetical protein ACFWVF_01580 [Streptomyces sp. NPDC058659]|uniref:hypothetical protein n=1 Tax=unclassified Streptomyces TaxID=2593676 RepID=UPI00365E3919
MVRGRGVRGKWCGALLLAAVLAGGASACGPGAPPAPGGPASGGPTDGPTSGASAPDTPGAPTGTTGTTRTTDPSRTAEPTRTTEPSRTAEPTRTADASAPVTASATAPRDEPQPGEVLVEVVVSGGLAGVRNQLVVHYDGSWTSRSGTKPPRTGQQTPAEAAELRAALEDPAYARVPNRPTGSPIADGFQYVITHRHRLVVSGDGERPPALQRVFAALPDGGPPTSP